MANSPTSKDFLKPPFSAYDFFGYLIPAFAFFLCIFLFEVAAKDFLPSAHLPLSSLLARLNPSQDSQVYQAALVLGIVLVAYVCGHIIATMSSVLLDRVLIAKAHGYPSENLYMLPPPSLVRDVSQRLYRGTFAWGNIIAWVCVVLVVFEKRHWAYFIFLAACGFIILAILLYLWVKYGCEKDSLKPLRTPVSFVSNIYAFPYNIVWWLLNLFFQWDKPVSARASLQFNTAFNKQFCTNAAQAGTDNYWFCTFYIMQKAPDLYLILKNWFHLYSFARNVAAAVYLAFCYGVAYIATLRWVGQAVHPEAKRCFLGILATFFIVAFILMVRYHYLYFTYYSKNLFRVFVYLKLTEASDSTGERDLNEPDDDITTA